MRDTHRHTHEVYTASNCVPTVCLNGFHCFLNCQIKHVTLFEWDIHMPAASSSIGKRGVYHSSIKIQGPFPLKKQLEGAWKFPFSVSHTHLYIHMRTRTHNQAGMRKSQRNLLSISERGWMDNPPHLVTITSQAASSILPVRVCEHV